MTSKLEDCDFCVIVPFTTTVLPTRRCPLLVKGLLMDDPYKVATNCDAHHFRLNLGVRDENSLAFEQCKELPWRGRVSSGTQEEKKKHHRFGFK